MQTNKKVIITGFLSHDKHYCLVQSVTITLKCLEIWFKAKINSFTSPIKKKYIKENKNNNLPDTLLIASVNQIREQ